jgi:hypothetical protein
MSRATSNFDGQTVSADRCDESGKVILCKCATGNIPSAVAGYAVGCILIDTTTGIHYTNTGSATSCTFTKDSIMSTNKKGYYVAAVTTNGTTPANIFGATNGFAGTITGAFVIATDATAGNITLATTAGTVATIAKGTSAGGLVGATTVSNTTVASDGTCTVVSSVALAAGGQATIFVVFTVT